LQKILLFSGQILLLLVLNLYLNQANLEQVQAEVPQTAFSAVLHSAPEFKKTIFPAQDFYEIQILDRQAEIRQVLDTLPLEHLSSLQKIAKPSFASDRRALASDRSIYLNLDLIKSERELRRVLIHEVGHVLDLGKLKAREKMKASEFKDGSQIIYETDESLDFYRICWESSTQMKVNCQSTDFPSLYAQTDVFEDFAESYLLFVENQQAFKLMAESSAAMQAKYNFFRQIFGDEKIQTGLYQGFQADKRVWDLTLL